MALAQGDFVALARVTSPTFSSSFAGPLMIGQLTSAAAPWDILWDDGSQWTGIASEVLDKIDLDIIQEYEVVRITNPGRVGVSSEYDCLRIRRYTRELEGAGGASTWDLLYGLASGQWFEIGTNEQIELER